MGYKFEPSLFSIEIDLNEEFFWGIGHFIRGSDNMNSFVVKNIPFAIHEGFYKRIILQFLSGNIEKYKDEKKHHEFCIYEYEEKNVKNLVHKVFGEDFSSALFDAMHERCWQWFQNNKLMARIKFLQYQIFNHPSAIYRNMIRRIRVLIWKFNSQKTVPELALIGDSAEEILSFKNEFIKILELFPYKIINVIDLNSDRSYLSFKNKYRIQQRLLGILIYCCSDINIVPDDKIVLKVDVNEFSPKEVLNLLITKHTNIVKKLNYN